MAGLSEQTDTALCLIPSGSSGAQPVSVVVQADRLSVLAALALMTGPAFELVLRQAMVNPMPIGATTEDDRLTLSVFYHTAQDYLER